MGDGGRGERVQSLVRELRLHMIQRMTKKEK